MGKVVGIGQPFYIPIRVISLCSAYGVYLIDWPQLNYTKKSSYSLSIECEDGRATATWTYTVDVIENNDPTIDNTNCEHNKVTIKFQMKKKLVN